MHRYIYSDIKNAQDINLNYRTILVLNLDKTGNYRIREDKKGKTQQDRKGQQGTLNFLTLTKFVSK